MAHNEEEGGYRIGRWDCKYCGFEGNLGPQINCKGCGSARSKDVEFYLPEDAEYVTDPALLLEAQAGADWICSYCSSGNKAGNVVCFACGNDRSEKEDKTLEEKEYSLEDTPDTAAEAKTIAQQERQAADEALEAQAITEEKGRISNTKAAIAGAPLIIGLLLIGGLVLWGVIAFFSWALSSNDKVAWENSLSSISKTQAMVQTNFSRRALALKVPLSVQVNELSWERKIDVEVLKQIQYEGDYVPSGSTRISSRRVLDRIDKVPNGQVSRTRQVRVVTGSRSYKCGTINKGNGYFQDKMCTENTYGTKSETYYETVYRDVPVYKDRFTYLTPEWHVSKPVIRQGTDRKPMWPPDQKGDKLRETQRHEWYFVNYTDYFGKTHIDTVAVDFWKRHESGHQLEALHYVLQYAGVDIEGSLDATRHNTDMLSTK